MNLQRVETEYNTIDAECAAKHHYNNEVEDAHNIRNLRLLKCELNSSPLKMLHGELHKLEIHHGIELLLKGVKAYNDELSCAINNDIVNKQCKNSEYCNNLERFERWLDVCDGVHFTDSYGNSLLHWACAVGYVDAVKVLLRAGLLSSLEMRNVNGATPLLCAAATATNAETMIHFLISHGANIEVHTSRSAFDTLESLLAIRNMQEVYECVFESCEPMQKCLEWNEKCGLYNEKITSFAGKFGTREAAREFVYYPHCSSEQLNKRCSKYANDILKNQNCQNVINVTEQVDPIKENACNNEPKKDNNSTFKEESYEECPPKKREREREHEKEIESTSISMSTNNSLLPAALLPYAKEKLDFSPTQSKPESKLQNLQHRRATSNSRNNNKNYYRYAEIEEEEENLEEEENNVDKTDFAIDVANINDDIVSSAESAMLFVKLRESMERMKLERNYEQGFALVATKWGNVWHHWCFQCCNMELHYQQQKQQKQLNDAHDSGNTSDRNVNTSLEKQNEHHWIKEEKYAHDNFMESQILAVLGERYNSDGTRVLLLHVKETASTEGDMNNIDNRERNTQNVVNDSIVENVEENNMNTCEESKNASLCLTVKWMPLTLVQNNEVVQRYCNKYDKTYFTLTPTIIQGDEANRPLYTFRELLNTKNGVKSHIRYYCEEKEQSSPLACSSHNDCPSLESSPFAHMGATERAELEEELRRIPRRTLSPEKIINSSSQPLFSASTLFGLQKNDLPNEPLLPCLSKEMLLVAHDTTTNSAAIGDQVQNERSNDDFHQKEMLLQKECHKEEPQANSSNMSKVNSEENANNRYSREVQIHDVDCVSPTHFNSTEKPEIRNAVCNTESVNCETDEVDDPYRLVMPKTSHSDAVANKTHKTITVSNVRQSKNKSVNDQERVVQEEEEKWDSAKETSSSSSRRAPRLTYAAAEQARTKIDVTTTDKCINNNFNIVTSNNKEEQRLLREQQQQQTNNNININNVVDHNAVPIKDRKRFLSTMEKASYEEFLFHSALEVLERRRERATKVASKQGVNVKGNILK